MAIMRSVSALAPVRGEGVWSILCRAALRSIEWAAEACGTQDAGERVERTELLVEHGVAQPQALLQQSFLQPSVLQPCPSRVDWARLGESDRARLATLGGYAGRRGAWH